MSIGLDLSAAGPTGPTSWLVGEQSPCLTEGFFFFGAWGRGRGRSLQDAPG